MKLNRRVTIDNLHLTINRLIYKVGIVSYKRGQSIVELVIGLGVVIILAMSLVGTNLITQKTSRSAQNEVQATKFAQQGTEEIRIIRDQNGYTTIPTSPTGCYKITKGNIQNPATWSLTTTDCITGGELIQSNSSETAFTRVVKSADSGTNRKIITVTVSWNESGNKRSVKNETFLTSWCTGAITPGSPCPTP